MPRDDPRPRASEPHGGGSSAASDSDTPDFVRYCSQCKGAPAPGEVVQVEPKLKLSGTTRKRLKLKYDNMVSSFAFNFNLRRYILEQSSTCAMGA
jgi:hypothetical protein